LEEAKAGLQFVKAPFEGAAAAATKHLKMMENQGFYFILFI
jgi:hypothetical protein